MICGSGGSPSRLAKAAGAEPCGQMRDEKLHAFVARSTIPSQNAQNTPGPDYYSYFRLMKFLPNHQGKFDDLDAHLSRNTGADLPMPKRPVARPRAAQ